MALRKTPIFAAKYYALGQEKAMIRNRQASVDEGKVRTRVVLHKVKKEIPERESEQLSSRISKSKIDLRIPEPLTQKNSDLDIDLRQ